MKKLYILAFCISTTISFAQLTPQSQAAIAPVNPPAQNPSTTLIATEEIPNWQTMLSNLPINQITSGVLLDKVVDYANKTKSLNIDK